jgi:hypothetical protein
MYKRIVRLLALVAILFMTQSLRCGGYRHVWFRVTCAVARYGAEPGMAVGFNVLKLDQGGKVITDKIVERTEVTDATGWTPEFICDFDMLYDDRSTEYIEDIRVIATVNDEGTIYKDTAKYTPQIFLNDTQSVSLRIDLPTGSASAAQASGGASARK